MPIVIGALDTVLKNQEKYVAELKCNISFEVIKKSSTVRNGLYILRRILY